MEAVSVVQVLHQVCSLGSKVKQQNETLKSGLELLRDQRVSLQEKLGSGELAPSELLHKCLLKLKDAIEAIKEFQKANVIEQAFKRKSLLRCLKDCEARVTDILATQRFINAESTINRWQGMYNMLDGLAEDIHTLVQTKQVDTRFPEGVVRAGVFM
ncbi:hypothetical protein Poli38472_004762 [Pythium oligandrum]|uniref:Uncharacterized protein n=1 Tax=Pythium oligandrum TaxID=41045 RepID=A0A8K1CBN1_PYTOL|nr:hypothetical protein Poli38472_004762 [Pythium oligandrum]|eukprot:TMW59693.1 hypothetical protein Poli38472_004762 [Pythium oligandrum]